MQLEVKTLRAFQDCSCAQPGTLSLMAPWRLPLLAVSLLWGWLLASSSSSPSTVAPPQDLRITDPGLLGSLDVEWKPPPHAQTFQECTVKYKLEYHSTGDRDWKVIFTRKLKLRVGFDLSRTAEVRLQTLLKGRCTGDVEVQSDWIYATFQIPPQGKLESEVQKFKCIYHDWEYLKCTWQPGLLTPHGVHYGLYYWYEGLEQAVQCAQYIQEQGLNLGCVLHNLSQAEYRDLHICVNGSAAGAQLRPLYSTLRLHNLGKGARGAAGDPAGHRTAQATACIRGLHSRCAFGAAWLERVHFPKGRGCGMCPAGFQFPGGFAGKQHPPAQPWRTVGASKCCMWTAQDTNGLLGMWQSSYGVFASSSTVTETSSFTPAGIETTAALLANTGELFGLCCSNQAKVWGELSARCDGVCQRWISNP
ncbi:interleukin-13 receptor subunit alpha-2 isoform X4 [Agelaius tricolor]|uniref:interleukin-13 receptor subunit alpha-2 isoform X4 n=1 Tax=Agelaius tricolor TaxID=9191 RepID=UPI0039F16EA2